MSVIAAVRPVLPPRQYRQEQLTDMFLDVLGEPSRAGVVRRLHSSAKVRTRHVVLELDEYRRLSDFGAANDAFLEHAVELGTSAVRGAIEEAGLRPEDVDVIFSTTVTGVAAPSIEARIAGLVGLRPDVKRVPMFGLGCVAGASGIARLHDYLSGAPDEVGVLLSVELCSLTMQRGDSSTANLVASGLFGDGASAVVALGDARAERETTGRTGPRVLGSRSHLYPDTQRTMGWDVTAGGLKIVLDAEVPGLVQQYLGEDVTAFLAAHGLQVADVAAWVCHPGGPKVIEAIQDMLGLPAEALELTWRSLAEVGNLSSSSVLHVLSDTIEKRPPAGTPGLLMAMGPGFCSELVLLRWQ
ncbi:MAG: type III polyketide synthase [Jatrophihabitantaceae bacterium]